MHGCETVSSCHAKLIGQFVILFYGRWRNKCFSATAWLLSAMTGDPEYIIFEVERAEPENQEVKLNICVISFDDFKQRESAFWVDQKTKTCKTATVKKKSTRGAMLRQRGRISARWDGFNTELHSSHDDWEQHNITHDNSLWTFYSVWRLKTYFVVTLPLLIFNWHQHVFFNTSHDTV